MYTIEKNINYKLRKDLSEMIEKSVQSICMEITAKMVKKLLWGAYINHQMYPSILCKPKYAKI